MNGEQRVDTTLPVTHRYEHDREHDWRALERFADLATRAGQPITADDYVFTWKMMQSKFIVATSLLRKTLQAKKFHPNKAAPHAHRARWRLSIFRCTTHGTARKLRETIISAKAADRRYRPRRQVRR